MIRKLRAPGTRTFLVEEFLRKLDAGQIRTCLPSPSDRTPEEERKALNEEMQNSSPRAAIALIEAVFSDYLTEAILAQLALCHEDDEIRQGALKLDVLQEAIPRSLHGKINLAYALDIIPATVLDDLHTARKVRNDCIHKAAALTPEEESEIKSAAEFFSGMLLYLDLVTVHNLGKNVRISPPQYGVPRTRIYWEPALTPVIQQPPGADPERSSEELPQREINPTGCGHGDAPGVP